MISILIRGTKRGGRKTVLKKSVRKSGFYTLIEHIRKTIRNALIYIRLWR